MRDFLFQQIRFVKEQNHRNVDKESIVHYRFKDVTRLNEPVRRPVLHQHLIKCARRHEEQNCCDFIKALKPFRSLRSLAANVDHSERNTFYIKVMLHDAFSRFPRV